MEIKSFLRIRPVSMANKDLYDISEDKKAITIKESMAAGSGMGVAKKRQVQNGPPTDSEFRFD